MIRILLAILLISTPAIAQPKMAKCRGAERVNCVVDGDTIWLKGVKYRLEGYDTPEPETGVCGGEFERKLAKQASDRLVELMNGNPWTLTPSGKKGRYKRALARLTINGEDAGNILIREKLARSWPDGKEWWCR